MVGAMRVAHRKHVSPIVSWEKIWILAIILFGLTLAGGYVSCYLNLNLRQFFIVATVLNGIAIWLSLRVIRKVARGLTVDSEELVVAP